MAERWKAKGWPVSPLYTTPPQPAEDYPACDYCGCIPDHHPWHGSGFINGAESPHIHACNDCRHLLPKSPQRAIAELRGEVERLKDALEIESHRLAACGVAALGYFDGCAEEYHSASLHDVLALRAQLAPRQPDGWKLVPVEPTPEMVSAAEEAHMPFGDMDIALRMAILAAPSAPKADDPVKQMLLEALENTATWIEQLPVPTVGAAGQLVKIDKAITAARKGEGE